MSQNPGVKKTLFPTPQDAETAFYDALTKCDLEAMMAVWGDDDDVYCVHPNGARVTGVEGSAVRLGSYDEVSRQGSLGREYTITYRDRLEGNERVVDGAVLRTESFHPELFSQGWRACDDAARAIAFDLTTQQVGIGRGGAANPVRAVGTITGLADDAGKLDTQKAAITAKVTGTLPTAVVDALANQRGALVDLLGATTALDLDAQSLSRTSGRLNAKMKADNAVAVIPGSGSDEAIILNAHYDGWRGIDHVGTPVPAMLARASLSFPLRASTCRIRASAEVTSSFRDWRRPSSSAAAAAISRAALTLLSNAFRLVSAA